MLLKAIATGILALAANAQSSGSLEQAKRAFDAGRYAEAAQLFEAASARDAACDISFYLGITRYRLRQGDAALIAFGEAARCNPKNTDAFVALGDLYSERGNEGEALQAYERALALQPDNVSALRGAATLYLRNKSDSKAVAVLERLVQKTPRDAQAHADLGAGYFATGNQEGAEKEFAAALRLDAKLTTALLGQSNLLLRKGEEASAIRTLQHVVDFSPKSYEARFLLGSAYNRMGKFGDAAMQLEVAAKLGGTEPEIFYHLARAYGGLGRTEDRKTALAKFAELSRQEKEQTEARRSVLRLVDEAKGLVQAGDLPAALARMEQARDLRPQDHTVLFRVASLDYDLARYGKAKDAIQEALALAPAEWIYHFLLGLVEGRLGHLEQARASLDIAVRLNPSAADAQNALGEVALRQGDRKLAEASFRRASELDPGQPDYRKNLEFARKAAQ